MDGVFTSSTGDMFDLIKESRELLENTKLVSGKN